MGGVALSPGTPKVSTALSSGTVGDASWSFKIFIESRSFLSGVSVCGTVEGGTGGESVGKFCSASVCGAVRRCGTGAVVALLTLLLWRNAALATHSKDFRCLLW
ncbi:hypothetical protein E2C01_069508 [Portunus trituberculatus]|uniref:Uncharacterized protein n=1 Tax=Portunus trituberculatus TaxID=210409 RepID=A0A5B7HYQ9_PORTR|nr:hypothetical protein [Portunus trituberculatus]